jgi:formylglycine-generating enzyme required for sulfatase activity
MGKLLRFLVLACVVQAAGAQGLFKGFTPDENGTNLDAPQASKTVPQKVAPGTVIKDCPECPEMVVLPSGSFMMGSKSGFFFDSDRNKLHEKPQHLVIVPSFLMGKTEVTQAQWISVTGGNPSRSNACGDTCPVENMTWNETQDFIRKLNQLTGQNYRLPSEAEWEYAARAGTTTDWNFGSDESKLGSYAWYVGNTDRTRRVGQKLPNAFGLFDMHGNVWEWTQDCWHDSYAGAPTDGSVWTVDCTESNRVVRGGTWYFHPIDLRSAIRGRSKPDGRSYYTGFRLARDL